MTYYNHNVSCKCRLSKIVICTPSVGKIILIAVPIYWDRLKFFFKDCYTLRISFTMIWINKCKGVSDIGNGQLDITQLTSSINAWPTWIVWITPSMNPSALILCMAVMYWFVNCQDHSDISPHPLFHLLARLVTFSKQFTALDTSHWVALGV